MGRTGKKDEPPKQADDKSKKKPPLREDVEDEYYEDGDVANPKRDRYGTDDEPL